MSPEAKEPWQMTRHEYSYGRELPETKPELLGDEYWRAKEAVLDSVIPTEEIAPRLRRSILSKRMEREAVIDPTGTKRDIIMEVLLGAATKSDIRKGLLIRCGQQNRFFEHREIVEKALGQGKPVPAEVLKDYPDLVPKAVIPTEPPPVGVTKAGRAYKPSPWR
ncbi:MAG: hypothetical protein ABIH46_01395 [Chloroflexota bacterium]